MLSALTLDHLRILVTISDAGSFSAAGRRLNRVQSAISQSVRSLETLLDVQLFDRSHKTPKLTEAGRVLVDQARHVLLQASTFESVAQAIASGVEPELTLAVDSMVPTQLVLDSLRDLREEFPDLPVTLYTEVFGSAQRRLRDHSAALALCVMLPTSTQDLQAHHLMSVTMIPVVASSHPLAKETREITREMLIEHVQLVLTDPDDVSGISHGVISSRIWRFVDLGRRLDFILAGLGWANMPSHIVAPYLEGGRLIDLGIRDPGVTPGWLPIFAVHERSSPPKKAARWLLDNLRSRVAS